MNHGPSVVVVVGARHQPGLAPRRRPWAAVLALALTTATLAAADSAVAKRLFADPPRQFSTGPLWVWNDRLTTQEVVGTLRQLADQDVKQVFVHPRPGLMTPYLSAEWFGLWRRTLQEAERLDMNVWIYDENSYPSGFGGGWVPELMPAARGRGLVVRESTQVPARTEGTLAVFRRVGTEVEDVSAPWRAGEALPPGPYLVATVQRAANSPWTAGRSYVDLMYPGVTEKFLEVTLEAYRREVGDQFGRRIPGVFSDEPNLRPAGGLPWTDGLPTAFQGRWGYSLLAHLASLTQPVGDWRKVRHDYLQVLNDTFIEHWSRPYHDYCQNHHLEWTGHYWDHEWPDCLAVPDNMAMYAWHQRPAIDCLMNQYHEDTHAQFGNARMVRELASVANQLGVARTLCEAYGAGGWDLRLEDMKRIGDWLYVLGVNTLDQHLSYVTLRGARKRDHPQSFSYHEPWWPAYHVSARYFARLSAALSQGQQRNRILVLEPTTTAWMYQGDGPRLKELGDTFFRFVMSLEAAQVEYDLGSEDILARHGAVEGAGLRVGARTYDCVVLPPLTHAASPLGATLPGNLNQRTHDLLGQYLRAGGRVLSGGAWPALIDGSPHPDDLSTNRGWQPVRPEALPGLLRQRPEPAGFALERADGDHGILFHQRRELEDGQLVFLVNSSIEAPSAGVLRSGLRGVERWDPDTGRCEPYPFAATPDGVTATFHLPPSGSLLLFLSKAPLRPALPVTARTNTVIPIGPVEVARLGPNVLTLDYVDVTAGGETRGNVYCYQANQFAFQKNGWARDPWDSAVQFRDELITRPPGPDTGCEVTYRFELTEGVPPSLALVVERPDLYRIVCNGREVGATKDAWWLDRAFGKVDLGKVARVGENRVTLRAAPFTLLHEIEPAYLLGDFTLRPGSRGFVVAAARPLALGPWNQQGQPFYGAGVAYTERFQVGAAQRYLIAVPAWYGSVAEVLVNGHSNGYLVAPPWEVDVTRFLHRGENQVQVVVLGTLKNTLGPHHGHPAHGSAWPGAFQVGPHPGPPPGAEYDTIGYGLFEPFVLHQVTLEADRSAAAPSEPARAAR